MKIEDLYPTDEEIRDAIRIKDGSHPTISWLSFMGLEEMVSEIAKFAVDNAVKKIIANLPQRQSILEMRAYQGPPPKKWLRETAPYYEGRNKAISEIEQSLKELINEQPRNDKEV